MVPKNEGKPVNPAVKLGKLIKQFDDYLSAAGIAPIRVPTHEHGKSSIDSSLEFLAKALETLSLNKLQPKYEAILYIVAEIVANYEEEPYFSNLKFPPLPNAGFSIQDNLREFIIYVAFIREQIQPLINDQIGSDRRNQFLVAINSKKKALEKGFYFEFSDGDLKRIQQIINELRTQVTDSDLFDADHKRRLLRRLEALQSEIHKKMSDVDRIWGLVGDAGIALGKFGRDAKPIVDRIRELTQIAWRTQARTEELPSSSVNPLLENEDDL